MNDEPETARAGVRLLDFITIVTIIKYFDSKIHVSIKNRFLTMHPGRTDI